MAFLFVLLIAAYILIGSSLGGFYYYLMYKEDSYSDLEDMYYLPVWITIFWFIVAPLAFAIYYAKKKVESEDDEK